MRTETGSGRAEPVVGDVDLTVVAGALAERARARMVLAVEDGRAPPASVLAGSCHRRDHREVVA